MTQQNSKLPLGIQNFEEMRRDHYIYADKTDMVWKLANGTKYYYLSRPRRFGKSLLCSTLKCYFEGRKELFEGLKMMELETEWIKRPVIYFSMSLGGSSAQTLTEYLNNVLSSYEKIYGRNPDEQSLGNRLNGIIQRAYEQAGVQIAIIVDEYDVPLLHTYDTDHHDACREIYRNFFTGLKDYGYCIKCVFITGVTKLTQISMFGMLNTLVNISFRNEYAAICGFTKDEVICNFSEHLSELADNNAITKSTLMDTMSSIYGGYHFSRCLIGVYNPFSVCNALANLRLNSYWIASGSNEMLLKVLRKFIDEIPDLDNCLIDSDYLEMSDVNMNEPKLFLYQSGYLTIKKVVGSSYMLGYPNREVRNAMFGMILPIMLHKESSQVNNAIQELKISMLAANIERSMLCLKQLIAGTPYSTQKKEIFVFEEHFRFILKNIFYLCGFKVSEEQQMSAGRIDLAVETSENIYILELKMSDNGGAVSASQQIVSHHYADAYAASSKPVISLSLEFEESRG